MKTNILLIILIVATLTVAWFYTIQPYYFHAVLTPRLVWQSSVLNQTESTLIDQPTGTILAGPGTIHLYPGYPHFAGTVKHPDGSIQTFSFNLQTRVLERDTENALSVYATLAEKTRDINPTESEWHGFSIQQLIRFSADYDPQQHRLLQILLTNPTRFIKQNPAPANP